MAATVYERDNCDDDGYERSLKKCIRAASISFHLYSISFNSTNAGKVFLELNSKRLYRIHEKEKKVVVLCSRSSQNVGANNNNNNIYIIFIFIKYIDKPLNVWKKNYNNIIIDNILTIKILFTINSLKKKLFRQNTMLPCSKVASKKYTKKRDARSKLLFC